MMKKIILETVAILLLAAGGFSSCGKEKGTSTENHGVLPSSIEQVVDIFELKYEEEKEWHYNDYAVKFTVTDVEDNLINCSTVYVPPEEQEKFYERTRVFAYLRIETDNQTEQVKVGSQSCWVYEYENNDANIQNVWDMLESWNVKEEEYSSFFKEKFLWAFGQGIKFENIPFSIYIVKAYPLAYKSEYNVEKRQYKFCFIITEN
jgi:hypothetical protein